MNSSKSTTDQSAFDQWLRFKAGDAAAFGQLSEHYYRLLYNYGTRFSADSELIRDCIQELFYDLWNRRAQLSDTVFVKAYLLKAFRHKLIKESVRAKHFKAALQADVEFRTEDEPSIEQFIVASEQQQELIRHLHRQIGQLTKRQQEIIYLRFYQQLDHDQIAEVMNLSRPSVANLLYRSLKELKNNWYDSSLPLLLILNSYALINR
ncbi:RNA polymerase sigma factor [Larkinella harenae]